MTIKKTALSTSIILAMGFTIPVFAKTERMPEAVVDGEAIEIECITQAEVDSMAAEDIAKLNLPVCEDTGVSEMEQGEEESKLKVAQ